MNDHKKIMASLGNSELFREFAWAFYKIAGVQVYLEPANCSPQTGAVDSKFRQFDGISQVVKLSSGLYRLSVPIQHGAQIIAIIRTGLILERSITTRHPISRIPVISKSRRESLVKLIALFAAHLGNLSNQLVLQQKNCEPAFVLKARQYIDTHLGDDLKLSEVARNAHVSTFHLCKMFKKTTGINFANYVSRSRIEVAKELLLKRRLRISEVAYEAGFHSITQFNRAFKKLVGASPRIYRERLSTAGKQCF